MSNDDAATDGAVAHAADRYQRIAGVFDQRVRAVPPDRWDTPAPCEGWVARDVVGHLAAWVPGFLSSQAGLTAPDLPDPGEDPVGAWSGLDDALAGWLASPETAGATFEGPMGTMTVAGAIDQLVTTDILLHTWDLARATGLDDTLDPAEIAGMLEGMEPMDEVLRASGHYGPRFEVDAAAPYQDRLLAFIGRDPSWLPPGGQAGSGT